MMTPKRFFFVMCGVLALLVLLGVGSAVMANNMLTKKNTKLSELKLENEVLEQQKVAILQAQKDIEKYEDLEKIAKQIVPQDKDQARTVRELVALAQQSGIDIGSLSFPSSNLGVKAAPAPKAAEGEASTTPKVTAPPITQVTPVEGIQGVYKLEVTVQNGDPATFPKLITFLEKLETNRRTAQVTDITITPNSANRSNLSFTMKVTVYIKP